MGQDRKNRQSCSRRLEFYEELADDAKIEKLIGYRQITVITLIILFVVIREIMFPSHLYLTDILF